MSQIESIKELHSQGQYQQAIQGYRDILANEPNNDEAHFGLAHASSHLNQLEQALKHVKEAVKLVPSSYRYQQFKGQMLLANNHLDEALTTFKRSIKENPNLFSSYLAVGDIYAMKNESEKAKKNYQLALKVHQSGIPATIKLARLLIIEGDYEGAEDLLQEAELQFPEEPSLKLLMGIMHLEQEKHGFAEIYFNKLLEDEPENHVAKAYLAISLLRSDKKQSSQIITELLNAKIKIPELMVAVGLTYVNNGNYQEAVRHLSAVCQASLAYPSWLMALAQAHDGIQETNTAVTVLEAVLARGNNSRALLMLGQIHQVNHDFPTAIKTFRKVSQESKDYNQSLLMQAECHYATEDYSAVLETLEPLLSSQPDHNTAIKLKLHTLSQMQQYDQALAVIDAIDAEKQVKEFNQLMHLYAGLFLDEKQQYDQAWQHFDATEPTKPFEIKLLSADEEKMVQQFPTKRADTLLKFVFTDPATGHHDFVNWCMRSGITPLIDRFTRKARGDAFSEQWSIAMLDDLNETQIHFLRKKYIKQLQQTTDEKTQLVVDFMPLSPINLAIIKRIFPEVPVLILTRNFADLRLHNRVFGSYQVHYLQFSKVANQMVAMNPNVALVDIDAWQNQDEVANKNLEKVFGSNLVPFSLAEVKPLDRLIFPFMHWKNYQQQLNK